MQDPELLTGEKCGRVARIRTAHILKTQHIEMLAVSPLPPRPAQLGLLASARLYETATGLRLLLEETA
ncbi:hypothetical protein [Streptomyces sp. NPDC020362]|uniref:hypothetical protein n=1 Tax=unclassified Streptomyces TaxID=2593676 RepID=UPI0033E98155